MTAWRAKLAWLCSVVHLFAYTELRRGGIFYLSRSTNSTPSPPSSRHAISSLISCLSFLTL